MLWRKNKVALVFGGGGARGIAHLGFLKVLEKNNLKPDIIVGTSFGSIIGAAYSTGLNTINGLIGNIEALIYSDEFKQIGLDVVDEHHESNFHFINKLKSSINKIRFYNKLLNNKYIIENDKLLSALKLIIPDINIEDLPVKFATVSLDVNMKTQVVFNKGSLLQAVLASSCIPGIFQPVSIGKLCLVDGGWINKVPVPIAEGLGADKIIAIDVSNPVKKKVQYKSGLDMMFVADRISQDMLKDIQMSTADIILRPISKKINWYNFYQFKKIIKHGERTAHDNLYKIKKIFHRSFL